jgi:glycosyltransferase involved in cell wall biosynthesis
MKTKLEDHFHVPPEKNLVIPNAIDISKYKRTINRNAVKKRYNLHSDDKLVLYIGRLVPQKGVEYLIQATPQLLQNNNNLHIFIIGDGWSRTSLETLANSTVHGNKIRFLGFIPDSEVVNLFLVADVLVIPSIYEPFGIVALEGMAAGVPVVAANVGGLAEIIDHDQTGVLVYVENPDSIAWGVNKVISNPEYSRRLIQNAKKKVQKEYSWSAVAKKTIKIYKEIYEG